jgi:hypothetical protein
MAAAILKATQLNPHVPLREVPGGKQNSGLKQFLDHGLGLFLGDA